MEPSRQNIIIHRNGNEKEILDLGGVAKLWLLIDYRLFIGPSKSHYTRHFEVIEARDVSGFGGHTAEIHTGKLVYVRKNSQVVQAIIVTISDDKSFLDQELVDMQEMQRTGQISENKPIKKRRRDSEVQQNEENYYQYRNEPSTSSDTSVIKLNVSHSNTTTQSTTPPEPLPVPVIHPKPVQSSTSAPPMTFDQQTQTYLKPNDDTFFNDARLRSIITNQEDILKGQAALALENKDIKENVGDLGGQLVEMKSLFQELMTRLEGRSGEDMVMNGRANTTSTPLVVFNQRETKPTPLNPPKILNLHLQTPRSSHQQDSQIEYSSNISIEPVEDTVDSSFSYSNNNSRMSMHTSSHSSYRPTSSSSSPVQSLNNTESSRVNNDNMSLQESLIEDLKGGNPHDEIVIGANNTAVPRFILQNINWNSHSAATRKLLRTKFSRETLASHSLTGKPSPAFMDTNKPIKNQLDQNIIADIIQYVRVRCNVSDTAVRSSITTKCADENKMMRQRLAKQNALKNVDNKENMNK